LEDAIGDGINHPNLGLGQWRRIDLV
jgi:hypothetical protein